MFDIEKLKHKKGIDQRTIAICEEINANEEKRNSCKLHDFEITGFSTKYRCKNCGCEEDSSFIRGYLQGMKHGKKAANSEIEQLKRERDAAINYIHGVANEEEICIGCKYSVDFGVCNKDGAPTELWGCKCGSGAGQTDYWEWRGGCDENGGI